MGRHKKIPGKKHRGVKDPEIQRARREEALKPKINSLPKNLNDQEIPKKLLQLMKGKADYEEKLKQKKEVKELKKKNKDCLDSSKHLSYEMRLPGMKRPLRPIPVFKQKEGESQKKFLNRMEETVQEYLKQRNYEEKYQVDLVRDHKTGSTTFVSRESDELEDELQKKKREKLLKKGIVVKSKEEKRQLRRQKEKERRQKKKRRRHVEETDLEIVKKDDDPPAFNEVAREPPSLKFPRRAEARKQGASKDLLLLKKLQKKDDRVEMSLAAKERLKVERERVVEEYRKLKKQKFEHQN